jgi:ribosomal-protein-alanine N-acetyltransferase
MESFAKNILIRQMTATDVPRVMEIAASLPDAPHWPESAYLDVLNDESMPRRIALVADGPKVQGVILASFLPPQAELESIAISAESQRQGLGRLLFDRLVNELKKMEVLEIVLEVRGSNHSALAFYRSAGFSQSGLRKGYYADPIEDAVLMRLRLS